VQPAGKLTRKQEQLIAALLSTASLDDAARQLGISRVTAWRWMKQEPFQQAYRAAKKEVVDHAIVLLQHCANLAVSTLIQVMRDKESTSSSKVAAARCVLELSISGIALGDLAAEIAEFQQLLKGSSSK
jgi:hypothetical protein